MQPIALAILLAISVGAFSTFAKFSFDMRRDGKYSAAWFWAAMAFWPGFLSALCLTGDAAMPIHWRNIILGTLGGAVGISTAIWLGYILHGQPVAAQISPEPTGTAQKSGEAIMGQSPGEQPPIINQGPGSAFSIGQQGGITAGTVNIAPTRAAFTAALREDLLKQMRSKQKPVQLRTVGGTEDQRIGDQVQEFLTSHGFVVHRHAIGVMAPPPDHPYSFAEGEATYVITVAPAAR